MDEGAASGVQTRARSDFVGREQNCIGSRWLEWKVVFQTSEGRLSNLRVLGSRLPCRRAEGRLRLALKVVFVWPRRSSSFGLEGRLRLAVEVVSVLP